MHRKIKPKTNNKQLIIDYYSKNSNVGENQSYFQQPQLTGQNVLILHCFLCKKGKSSNFIKICQCQDRFFHRNCAKSWIRNKFYDAATNIHFQQQICFFKCSQCLYNISFKKQKDERKRTYEQFLQYCQQNKFSMIFFILVVLMLIAGLLSIFLIGLGIIKVDERKQGKLILLVTISVFCGFFIIGLIICMRQFYFIDDITISYVYYLTGQRLKSFRNNEPKSPKQQPFQIQLIEE